jgi:DNA mismatch repair protein MutL
VIRLLDAETVGQIAAGEIVERPYSVVKELVENALDAGARRIGVSVTRGGLDTIDVADDGGGIEAGELHLAFARHATSKLSTASDLERVATLGFRGEGLASIAAVARVRLTSRTRATETGLRIEAFGAETGRAEPVAAPSGTRVAVSELFANVPVRREFLRSPGAEFARISSFLAMLALAYPQVTFSLANDGRTAWTLPASDSLAQRLDQVFGPAAARGLIALDARDAENSPVRGFISRPGFDRGDRRMQLLFDNDRLLRSTLLAGAWTAGYATFALSGRQPYGVLFLDLPFAEVDPNVHPTKSDVRLRHAERVAERVKRTLATTLARDAAARLRTTISYAPPGAEAAAAAADALGEAGVAFSEALFETPSAPSVLAQLDATYILAIDGGALLLVDQHAAHERVAYEAIAERANAGGPSEPLLVPYVVELEPADVVRFETVRETLAAAGFEAEPFGERAYRVLATPAGYGARAFRLEPFLGDLGDEIPGLSARERVWATLACHSVARAGERLDRAEMSALVARLMRCANPMHCPHGRPTMVRIEPEAVARMFKRT